MSTRGTEAEGSVVMAAKLTVEGMRGDERDVNTQGEDNHLTASRSCRVLKDQMGSDFVRFGCS
jgi:hypothetical protein